MKKTLLTFIAITSASVCFSQMRADDPGRRLQQFGTEHLLGTGMTLVGGFVVAYNPPQGEPYTDDYTRKIGYGVMVVGAVVSIAAWRHLFKAGELLENKQVSIEPAKTGVGLCLNF